SLAASRIEASAPFMSYAPRPYSRSPSTRGSNGACIPPTPTVSRFPFRSSERPPPAPRFVATTLGRSSPRTSTSNPCARHQSVTKAAIAPSPAPPGTSAGLTESIATSAAASSLREDSAKPGSAGGRRWRGRRRLAHDQSCRELDVRGLAPSAIEETDEHVDRRAAQLAERLTNRRQRRRDEYRRLDVVEPHDGEVFRHAQPAVARGAQRPECDRVVERDDRGGRLGEVEQCG